MKLSPITPAEIVTLSRSGEVLADGWAWGRAKRKLATAGDCRQEASRVYKMAAKGQLAAEDLSRAVYALTQIAKLSEQAELEDRIAQLEAMLRGRP